MCKVAWFLEQFNHHMQKWSRGLLTISIFYCALPNERFCKAIDRLTYFVNLMTHIVQSFFAVAYKTINLTHFKWIIFILSSRIHRGENHYLSIACLRVDHELVATFICWMRTKNQWIFLRFCKNVFFSTKSQNHWLYSTYLIRIYEHILAKKQEKLRSPYFEK